VLKRISKDIDEVLEVFDSCLANCNVLQLDGDSDSVGDLCDSTPGCGGWECRPVNSNSKLIL
jgi:hypothetical protein